MIRIMRPWQGGTFWYCPMNCYKITDHKEGKSRRTRFRTAKAARLHISRHHV